MANTPPSPSSSSCWSLNNSSSCLARTMAATTSTPISNGFEFGLNNNITGGASRATTTHNNNNNNNNSINIYDDNAELARELNQLSVNEREKIYEEIHGVTELPKETPEFVQECIQRFNQALNSLPKQGGGGAGAINRRALDKALFLKPSIETDIKFKLMFLRADDYNATKAARRFAKYFEDKLELFGESKLVKKITLDDLSEQDLNIFRSGFFLVLPCKDTSGRPIWIVDLTKYDFNYPESLIRCSWYQVMATLEDESSQMKGAVNICYCSASHNIFKTIENFYETLSKGSDMLVNIPIRLTSYHFCYSNQVMQFIQHVVRKTLGRQISLRFRAHLGSDVEIQYSLMTFGIVCPNIFGSDEYEKNQQRQQLLDEYLKRRLEKDRKDMQYEQEQTAKMGIVPYPALNDILVGRGRPYQNYSGNLLLCRLIAAPYFMDRYTQQSDNHRFMRTCIHMEVTKMAQETYGSRFLERTDTGWKVVDDQVARQKVSSAFRTRVSKHPTGSSAPTPSSTALSDSIDTDATVVLSSPASQQQQRQQQQLPSNKRLRYDPSIIMTNGTSSLMS